MGVIIQTDGFPTTIAFSADNTLLPLVVQEKSITPFGITGRGGIQIDTMRSVALISRVPKKLKDLHACTMTVVYATSAKARIFAIVNTVQLALITYPDASFETVYGWIDDFKPNAQKEGEQPTAELTFIASNNNPVLGNLPTSEVTPTWPV